MNESPAPPFQETSTVTGASEPAVISEPTPSSGAITDDGAGAEHTDLDAIAAEFDQIEGALPQLDDGSYFSGNGAHSAD